MLQTENLDLAAALELTVHANNILTDIRNNAVEEFKSIFNNVMQMCEEFGIDICIPRRAGRQTQRCNIMTNTPEEYYRISIFITFLDSVTNQIHDRLLKHKTILESFMCLLPNKSEFTVIQKSHAKILLNKYERILHCGTEQGIGELTLWWRYISTMQKVPKNAHEAFLMCDKNAFPTVRKLIQIMLSLPVTTAVNERSFSTLRRLKPYLRNTVSEDRLNGLALLNIHREIIITTEKILDELATTSRRLQLRI